MAISSLSGTGNQPYTTARVDYLATVLQGQLPGMTHEAAVKWINAERGDNGNVLGVTYRDTTGQHLFHYSSQEAGIAAAASLVRTSDNYKGIRTSLGQDAISQLRAIASSPWNAPGHYRNGATFGVTIGSVVLPQTSGITLASDPNVGFVGFQARMRELGISTDPTHTITQSEADTIVAKLYHIQAGSQIANEIAANFAGKTLLQAWNGGKSETVGPDPLGALGAVGTALKTTGNLIAALLDPQNWLYIGALVIGIPLALLGFYLLAGVPTGGRNA